MAKKKSSSYCTVARTLLGFYIAAVCFLCFAKFDGSITVSNEIFGVASDKVAHFLMFFPFPILAFLSMEREKCSAGKCVLYAVVTFFVGCCFAAGTELVQGLIKYRTADRMDLLADCISMSISTIIVLIIDLTKK